MHVRVCLKQESIAKPCNKLRNSVPIVKRKLRPRCSTSRLELRLLRGLGLSTLGLRAYRVREYKPPMSDTCNLFSVCPEPCRESGCDRNPQLSMPRSSLPLVDEDLLTCPPKNGYPGLQVVPKATGNSCIGGLQRELTMSSGGLRIA